MPDLSVDLVTHPNARLLALISKYFTFSVELMLDVDRIEEILSASQSSL